MTWDPHDVRRRHGAALRARGLRCTEQRLAVLAALTGEDGHLSAAQIRRRVIELGVRSDVSTVYRTAERLIECGILHRLQGPVEASYGLAGEPHDHALCDACGTGVDLPEPPLRQALQHVSQPSGYQVTGLVLHGLCGRCLPDRTPAVSGLADGPGRKGEENGIGRPADAG